MVSVHIHRNAHSLKLASEPILLSVDCGIKSSADAMLAECPIAGTATRTERVLTEEPGRRGKTQSHHITLLHKMGKGIKAAWTHHVPA